jgi:quercetin dioxygenase-like cupin family protein
VANYRIDVTRTLNGAIATWKTEAVAAEHRGWTLGTFLETPDGKELTNAFEVRAGPIKKGDARTEWAPVGTGVSFEVILSGRTRFTFLVNGEEIVREVGAGDSIFWDNSIPHKWECLEDQMFVFVRKL